MTTRIVRGTVRGDGLTLHIDGRPTLAFAGETVASVLLAAGRVALRRDGRGTPRGPFCNMGTCGECTVTIRMPAGTPRRLRACLVAAAEGMTVGTGIDDEGR